MWFWWTNHAKLLIHNDSRVNRKTKDTINSKQRLIAILWCYSSHLFLALTIKLLWHNTCGQMNPAPNMTLLASEGSTSGGIRCSVNIMVKLLKKANMKTWKKFMSTNSWKSLLDRICHIKVPNMEKENADWSSGTSASDSDPRWSKRLSLWKPV